MADKSIKVVLNISLLYLCIGLVSSQSNVIVEPSEVTVREGLNVTLLCRSRSPLLYCRFEIPDLKPMRVSDDTNTEAYNYYGNGLRSGDCGINLRRVDIRNNGKVKCTLGYQDNVDEGIGEINLVVGIPPKAPRFEAFDNQPLVKDNLFEDRCIVEDGRPEANIRFFLDNEELVNGVPQQEVYNQTDTVIVVRRVQFKISDQDNGKTLTCRAEHFAYPNGFQETKSILRVHYAPVSEPVKTIYGLQLERTAFVTVTIQSNPKPNVHWNIDNNVHINEGDTKDRYEAQAPREISEGKWNVTLVIDKLSLEDTTKTYNLIADNALGRQEYRIKISPSDAPISDLDTGAIIGIAVGCIALIVLVGLIIVARATGRWCFAEKTNGASNNTNNDEENGGLKTIGQHIIPFKQRLMGMVSRTVGNLSKLGGDVDNNSANRDVNGEENEKISTETAIIEDDADIAANKTQNKDKKDQSHLIYAELDIKKNPVAQTNKEPTQKMLKDNPDKTEYAEILYVTPQTSGTEDGKAENK